MEFVDGLSLAERIARGAIPIDEALPLARQVVEALEAAHDQGIIHRDLKPANIKLTPDGGVKVLDFAPAMMTGLGTIPGTAAYMAPEQARGLPVDKRADPWAFGC